MTFNPSMNSCRRGLRNGVLVNPKLFILEKVNFGQPTKCWSNLVKLVKLNQTWSNALQLVVFGTGHYKKPLNESSVVTRQLQETTHLFNISWLLPFNNHFYFLWIHLDSFVRYNVPKKGHFIQLKLTLAQFRIQLIFSQSL